MGNVEILKRGSLQLTSSGTGVSLCDDVHGPTPVHFLQIWSLPSIARLTPQYFTRYFSDAEKTDKWVCVVAPKGSKGVSGEKNDVGPAPVQSPLTLYATILGKGKKLEKTMCGKKGYVHVLQTRGYNSGKGDGASIRIIGGGFAEDELLLREGDGAYLSVGKPGTSFYIENTGSVTAEILLLDLE
jgi:redox-sensitive bicupin YhaK (pirin superfamily)